VRCIAVTGSFQMQTSEWKINPAPVNSRIKSPRKSRMPMTPSRSLDVGRFMQWNDTNRPGFRMRYSSGIKYPKCSMNC